MQEPRRPTSDEGWTHRVGRRLVGWRDRVGAGREPRSTGLAAAPEGAGGFGSNQPLPFVALTAVGSAALALGVLWAWQAWADRSSDPIDDALPMLVEQPGDEAVGEPPTVGAGGDGSASTPPAPMTVAPRQGTASDPASPGNTVDDGEPPPDASDAAPIVVHVSGAVRRAGVVELAVGARVYEAVEAAGGAIAEADLDRVNLAAPLVDGERIHVPTIGEEDPPELVPSVRPAASPGGEDPAGAAPVATSVVVDLNRAGTLELETLPGIGPATAQAIVTTRDARGPFRTVDELLEVPGIGPAKLEQLRPHVWVQAS